MKKPEIKGVIDTSDGLFAALAAMPNEKKIEMMRRSIARRKELSSRKDVAEKSDNSPPPDAPTQEQEMPSTKPMLTPSEVLSKGVCHALLSSEEKSRMRVLPLVSSRHRFAKSSEQK